MKRNIRIIKFPVVLLIVVYTLSGCSPDNNFSIAGRVPDTSYDGEWMYLVPLVNAPLERVDSSLITNGTFQFEGFVETPEIYIIRPKPLYRLSLQELLIVKEPGQTQAYLGESSVTGGTANNNLLHRWKEQKTIFDKKHRLLQNSLANSDAEGEELIKKQLDSLRLEKNEYHYNFALNNNDNVVGEMIIRFMKSSFTEEQKSNLSIK
ncbi:DUF4369 domain-containing protein [Prolixibacteraceae bacterium Z1-6]|uniref:DUF4369 domain-containing protein n=1 Tax=Draconibacterium aestuarii TaxID=2998507 RepID=A0A9X3FAV6_9BACT|nr:DUF4369 domain-containing protein [Prolixibacteraceae bacterium Z1-6]